MDESLTPLEKSASALELCIVVDERELFTGEELLGCKKEICFLTRIWIFPLCLGYPPSSEARMFSTSLAAGAQAWPKLCRSGAFVPEFGTKTSNGRGRNCPELNVIRLAVEAVASPAHTTLSRPTKDFWGGVLMESVLQNDFWPFCMTLVNSKPDSERLCELFCTP